MTVRIRLPITQACREQEFLNTGRRWKQSVTLLVPTTKISREARAVLFALEREQAPKTPTLRPRSSRSIDHPIIVFEVPRTLAERRGDAPCEVWEADHIPRTPTQWNRLIKGFAAYRRRRDEQRAQENEITQDTQNTQRERIEREL